MTGRTVPTCGEILANGTTDQSSIDIVTAEAGIVNFRIASIGQWRRVAVTVATAGRYYLNQAVVARGIRRMSYLPGTDMTGGAVTTSGKILTGGQADQIPSIGIVTASTIIMGFSGSADQSIVVATTTG